MVDELVLIQKDQLQNYRSTHQVAQSPAIRIVFFTTTWFEVSVGTSRGQKDLPPSEKLAPSRKFGMHMIAKPDGNTEDRLRSAVCITSKNYTRIPFETKTNGFTILADTFIEI